VLFCYMEKQLSFGDYEFQMKKKKNKKELFLERMEKIIPFREWCDLIRPFYYENGNGRQPTKLETMLRMYLVSNWFNLSDEGTEELVDDSRAVRNFVGKEAPDATTLCKFRKILEENNISKLIFARQSKTFAERKIYLREGTIVDATIIDVPKSKKNKDKNYTEGYGHTKKGKQNYTGIKAHIGVCDKTGIAHSAIVTPANVHDSESANACLHGDEKKVGGDSAYIGIEKRVDVREKFQDGTGEVEWLTHSHKKPPYIACKMKEEVKFQISEKRSKVKTEEQKQIEKNKSSIRAKVEHIFLILKHLFKYRKTKYRKANKNENHVFMLLALANLYKISTK